MFKPFVVCVLPPAPRGNGPRSIGASITFSEISPLQIRCKSYLVHTGFATPAVVVEACGAPTHPPSVTLGLFFVSPVCVCFFSFLPFLRFFFLFALLRSVNDLTPQLGQNGW